MSEDANNISCVHKADLYTPCPYLCQAWLNTFPWDKSNARFDKTDILSNFLKNVESILAGDLFDSIDLVYDNELNNIADNARASVENPLSDLSWKERLIEDLKKIDSLPTLNGKQFAVFQQLVSEKLIHNINANKSRVIPNVLIMTSEDDDESLNIKMVYNAHRKRKTALTAEDMVTMHDVLPELKSVSIKDLQFKMEKYGDAVVKKSCLESLDITFTNPVVCPSSFLAFLFRSYHQTIKSFRLGMSTLVLPKAVKNDREDRGSIIKKVFRENVLNFRNLETLEISNFSNWIDIDTVLRHIVKTCHNLKTVKFLGQTTVTSIFNRITESYQHSLESLTVTTRKYEDVRLLRKLKCLKELSYLWEEINAKIDILKVLMVLPNLTSLELGFEKRQGVLVSNVVSYDAYENLNRIALHNVHIDGNVFNKLSSQLPNLKNVALTSCRIGKSGSDIESTISFENYQLETLLIEDCKLNNSSKLSKNMKKRNITRFKFVLDDTKGYAGKLRSKRKDKSKRGRMFIDNNIFVYDMATNENESSTRITLVIKADLIRSFSVSKSLPFDVYFCLASEASDEDDSSADEGTGKIMEVEDDAEEIEEVEEVEETETGKSVIEENENIESDEEADIEEEAYISEEDNDVVDVTDVGEDGKNDEEEDHCFVEETEIVEVEKASEDVEYLSKETEAEENGDCENDLNKPAETMNDAEMIEIEDNSDVNEDEDSDDSDDNNDSEDSNDDEAEVPNQQDVAAEITEDSELIDIDTSSLPEIPESPVPSFEVQSSENDELEDSSSDIVIDEVAPETGSEYDSDGDEPVVIIKVNKKNPDTKKISISDEEYVSGEEDIVTSSSSDSEYNDNTGTRRSARLSIARSSQGKRTRKRGRDLFSSDEKEEEEESFDNNEDEDDDHGVDKEEDSEADYNDHAKLVSQFIHNCRAYNAVIRIATKSKRTRFNSPAL